MQKITINDKNFPELLKKIPNPPEEIYFRGELRKSEKYPLAVVGTRKMSVYGQQMAEYFVRGLAQANITIISGLALGIDSLAHKIALENNTKTMAVLGSGLDNIYPKIHQNLSEKIIKSNGTIISEYPPETPPYQSNFIARNRLISGLSLGVLVIEAPKKSGALITAQYALEQKRKVFVVPGRLTDENSAGTNQLIRQGGQLVQNPEQILKELGVEPIFQKKKTEQNLSAEEKEVLKILTKNPIHIDKLTQETNRPTYQIISILSQMELKGIIKNLGNNQYIKE
jgi:DNA processing protein